MSKLKRIIQFILALLNFLFHFKHTSDDETPDIVETVPPAAPPFEEGAVPLFEAIP